MSITWSDEVRFKFTDQAEFEAYKGEFNELATLEIGTVYLPALEGETPIAESGYHVNAKFPEGQELSNGLKAFIIEPINPRYRFA